MRKLSNSSHLHFIYFLFFILIFLYLLFYFYYIKINIFYKNKNIIDFYKLFIKKNYNNNYYYLY